MINEKKKKVTIDEIGFFWGKVPVKCHFSSGSVEHFPFMLVRLVSEGSAGWGETLCNFDDKFRTLADSILGCDAGRLDDRLCELLDIESEDRYVAEAFSMAGHNLAAQVRSKTLSQLLGPVGRTKVPLMPCIFPSDPEDGAATAAKFRAQGFSQIKFKLMGDVARDVETLRQIRKAVGEATILQGDANCGYSLCEVREGLLAKLKASGLDIIEDPCEGGAQDYAGLRSSEHPRIMIDVAARKDGLLREFLEAGGADLVNLHPCQQGTLTHAIERAKLCEEFGVPVMVGGTGFVGVGTAAYQQIAAVIGLSQPCGELGGGFDHGMPENLCGALTAKAGNVDLADIKTSNSIGRPNFKIIEPYLTGRICQSC